MKKTLLAVVLAASTVFAALPSKDAVDAVKKGDLTLFKKLVTDKEGANGSLENGKSILMYAVWEGREEIVKYLIDLGADVNAKDKEGKTALMLAAIVLHIWSAAKLTQRAHAARGSTWKPPRRIASACKNSCMQTGAAIPAK